MSEQVAWYFVELFQGGKWVPFSRKRYEYQATREADDYNAIGHPARVVAKPIRRRKSA